ncbi:MAG: 6,7-dimethyl-8-ribityllumazine synthase [Elusimicrobiota bacterium]
MKLGIVVADFNQDVTERLLASAKKTAHACGVTDLTVMHVPGCFEIPYAARLLAAKTDAVACLGCIIKGETDQNTYLAQACAIGIQIAQLGTGVPMGFGIISAPTQDLALARTQGELDRGKEAVLAAVSMARLKSPATSDGKERGALGDLLDNIELISL